MNDEPAQPPQKACRHCSVVSRTDAEICPSCGKRYERRPWRWWHTIPVAVIAFGAGYFGWQAIRDEPEPQGLTLQEAREVNTGTAPARVARVLDGQAPDRVKRSSGGGNQLVCRLYVVVDEERTAWEFCFLDGAVEISRPHEFDAQAGRDDQPGRKSLGGDPAARGSQSGQPPRKQAERHSTGKQGQALENLLGSAPDQDLPSQLELPPGEAGDLLGERGGGDRAKLPPELRALLKGADGSK
jgi:hypothetical protein